MKILVFGAGSIGMTFGGFLSPRHDVTLLGRKPHMAAVRRRGLRVGGIWGRHVFRRLKTATDPRALGRDYDLILLTVKSYDTEKAARRLRNLLGPNTAVVSLQNGVGNLEILRRHLPADRVLGARVIFGVVMKGPADLEVTVIAKPTAVGEASLKKITPRAKKIAAMFDRAGLPSVPAADIQSVLWAKLVYNCALNPLASLLGSNYGFLGDHGLTRSLMDEIIAEVYRVARAGRVVMNPPNEAAYRKLFYGKLVPSTYHHHPSMLQDLRNGKRTEIEALSGAVVRMARKTGKAAPVNEYLWKAIREKQAGIKERPHGV